MLAEGSMGLEDLPTLTMISTVETDGTELLFCLNNRRLWVMKQLVERGFFAERTVRVLFPFPFLLQNPTARQ